MCGIFGYTGSKQPAKVCLEGLKLLEYRGYDSSGIAGVQENSIFFKKEKGKIRNLELALDPLSLLLKSAISHTRWATHGKPTEENAHPQLDEKEHVAVVHNGIIENYFSLKRMLIAEGITFTSETDTEVIAQLMSFYYKGDLLESFQKTIASLKGFWAIALIHKDYPETILVSCKENPLAIGVNSKDQEVYLSSDVNAFYTADLDVLFLKNEEIAFLTPQGVDVFNVQSQKIPKTLTRMSLEKAQISKNGFPHFMLKEIFEQPETIYDCLRGRLLHEQLEIVMAGVDHNIHALTNASRIIIVACGTSWHAGLYAEYLIEELCRIPVEVEYASEFRYRNPVIHPGDVIIAISQSGETADTLVALESAKEKGAFIFGIVNAVGSSIARLSNAGAYTHAGPEIGVASTKAFTGQLTVLAMIALKMAKSKGSVSEDRYVHLVHELASVPEKIKEILADTSVIQAIALKFKDAKDFLYLGRGYNFPIALEGALKLKEITYIHAEGYPAAEMKHGPIALVDETLPVVFIATKDMYYDKVVSNIQEIKARKGQIIAVASEGDQVLPTMSENIMFVPEIDEVIAPLLSVVPMQLLSYYVGVAKGIDVDKPRNLAKSVTVE